MSATSTRNPGKTFDSADRPALTRDADSRDRYNFRGKTVEGEADRARDGRSNTLRPKRTEDQDSDGWSTVKPRKSFGTEGAERFNGRMGVDRHRDERRFKDREERDVKDRPRGFETFSRDKDGDQDQDRDTRRNGLGRGRNEPSWFKDRENADGPPTPRDRNSNGDRFSDRKGGWRDKERDDRGDRGGGDRTGDRGDRRWDRDRDQRQEREPEWMDEPAEDKSQSHTQEDFQKWREQQQKKDKAGKTPVEDVAKPDAGASFFGLDKKVETPLEIVETGPDKFLSKWTAPKEDVAQDMGLEPNEGTARAKTMGKASRFTSFFAPKDEPPRRQTEPPIPMPAPPQGGLGALFGGGQSNENNTQSPDERMAFQQLLMKLHSHTPAGTGSQPPNNVSLQPGPAPTEMQQSNPMMSPEPFQQYRTERQDENRSNARHSGQSIHELLAQRQVAGSQPTIRPDQMVQELIGQRQNAASQASVRLDQPTPSRNTNTEFLMGLMQSVKLAPEPQRSEQVLLRMPGAAPKPIDRQMQQQMIEREQDMQREAAQRERSASQRRPQPPPGFFDEAAYQRGPLPQHERQGGNPPQPTQILQRPPPGLDLGWDRQAQLPPQHRLAQNIAPPPGLANGPNRGMPMPQQMFPPGFPMGNFPPDVMPGPPRNMQMQPPPGFFNAPPPGFMPPGMGGGFPGPEGMAFGAPFDGRGPPPQGAFRRQ
jgi:eIF4E-associated protein